MTAVNDHLKVGLVVGVYLMHKMAATDDPMVFFYGDGAGAAVLEPSAEPDFLCSAFRADGSFAKNWAILAGGTVEPATEESVRTGRTSVKMYDRYSPETNSEGWPMVVRSLASNGGFGLDENDLAIFTQVRKPTIEQVMADLDLPMKKTHMVME